MFLFALPPVIISDNMQRDCIIQVVANGCYFRRGKEDGTIFISSTLNSNLLDLVLFHEVGHYFLRDEKDNTEEMAFMFSYWVIGSRYAENLHGDYFRRLIIK